MDDKEPSAAGRLDAGAVLLLGGSALLVVSFFLPWYTSTAHFCGQTQTNTQSAFAAGGWRFDLPVLALAAVAVSLLAPSRRRLTFGLAVPLPFLALFWLATYDVNGPSLSCPHPPPSAALYAQIPSSGIGFGATLGVVAAFAALVGAALHLTRRSRPSTGPATVAPGATGEATDPGSERVPIAQARRLLLVVAGGLAAGLAALVLSTFVEVALINHSFPPSGCHPTVQPVEPTAVPAGPAGIRLTQVGFCSSTDPHLFLIPLTTAIGLLAGGSATLLFLRRRSSPGGGSPPWPPGSLSPGV